MPKILKSFKKRKKMTHNIKLKSACATLLFYFRLNTLNLMICKIHDRGKQTIIIKLQPELGTMLQS